MENTGVNVQIRVNTFNRLKKIRAGIVYESMTTVIDELLQNCQRSFTVSETPNPVIDVTIERDYIIVRDNGKGCSDPQKIFEFETSGWDISDAFGQGGSESIFQIADYIEINSRGWKAKVDVLNILETENLDIAIEQMEDDYMGFEITLRGEKIKQNIALLQNFFISTLSIFDCNCYINGTIIPKKSIQDFKSEFKVTVDNKFYSATLGLQKGCMDCQVYYEKRKVCDLWKNGVYGIIELKRDAVNLKAPDRKAIIRDEQYDAFREWFNDDCKMLYLEFVQQATEKQFDSYTNEIDTALTAKDYADYLPYYDQLVQEQQRVKTLAIEIPSEKTVEEKDKLIDQNVKDSGSVYLPGGSGHTEKAKIEVSRDYKPKPKKGEFRSKLGKIMNIVWCEVERTAELQEFINMAENYKIKVIYSKGKLYEKSFQFWGIPHIMKVMNKKEAKYIIGSVGSFRKSDTELYQRENSKKEDRLLLVLSKIERIFGLYDVFRIADVREHIALDHEGETVMDTIIKSTSATIRDRQKIYLDRATLNLGKVNISESKVAITKFDVLIVMLNIQTIASGLAKILYNTVEKTVDHYNKVDKISKEIALVLATL